MIVEIKMFAVARQLAGCDSCRVEVSGDATVAEVKEAILSTANPRLAGGEKLASGGRLDAFAALEAEVFAPRATLVLPEDVVTGGRDELFHEITLDETVSPGAARLGVGGAVAASAPF